MDEATLRRVEMNIFPAAWANLGDPSRFPWHTTPNGGCDADRRHSSQALAVDFFGTLIKAKDRDAVLGRLAADLGLPSGGPWQVCLEWTAPTRLLGERRPTQVDALAVGASSLICFECKFTEPGGGTCSQTRPRRRRADGQMVRQCDGRYRQQVNPLNGMRARCALAAKGIRYWDLIPAVLDYDPAVDHDPCPFAGERFQWMRNLTLARSLGQARGKSPAFVIVYADGPGLPMADKIRSGAQEWLDFTAKVRTDAVRFGWYSYQELVRMAQAAAVADRPQLDELAGWIDRKVRDVSASR